MREEKLYKCDSCPQSAVFSSYEKARNSGWSLAKDYKECHCPSCAPKYRLGGAKKANKITLAPCIVQLGMEGLN